MEISFIQLMQNWREYYYLFVFFVGERHSDFHFDCYSPSRPFALIIRHLFIYSCIYLFLIISIYLFYFFFLVYKTYVSNIEYMIIRKNFRLEQLDIIYCKLFVYYDVVLLDIFHLLIIIIISIIITLLCCRYFYYIILFSHSTFKFSHAFSFFPFYIEYDIPRLSLFVLSVFASFYALFKWNLIFFAYNNNLFFLSFVARWLVEILLALRLETM